MTFGAETGEPEAHRLLDRFLEAGGTLVDTADTYGEGRSEEIIGRWFTSRPAEVTGRVVLATKGRFPLDGAPNGSGLSARHLTRALDDSTRLGEDPGRGMEAYDRRGTQRTWQIVDAVRKIAAERGVTMAEIALAWVTDRPAVSSTILGARSAGQLEANLRAADLHLTAQETAGLDAASDPGAPDYPYGELGADQRSRSLAGGR